MEETMNRLMSHLIEWEANDEYPGEEHTVPHCVAHWAREWISGKTEMPFCLDGNPPPIEGWPLPFVMRVLRLAQDYITWAKEGRGGNCILTEAVRIHKESFGRFLFLDRKTPGYMVSDSEIKAAEKFYGRPIYLDGTGFSLLAGYREIRAQSDGSRKGEDNE